MNHGIQVAQIFWMKKDIVNYCDRRRLMTIWLWVNIVSGHGMLPDGTRPLSEPKLINHLWGLQWHSPGIRLTKAAQDVGLRFGFRIYWFDITETFPRGQRVKICSTLLIAFKLLLSYYHGIIYNWIMFVCKDMQLILNSNMVGCHYDYFVAFGST